MNVATGCVLCRSNGLFEGPVMAETEHAYLTTAKGNEHNYLIIPASHVASLTDLPDDWWRDAKDMLKHIPDLQDYNLSLNYGKSAGQTLEHIHFWIIPRVSNEPAAGKGLARLINEANQE